MGLSCGATLYYVGGGLATALPAVAPLDAFPFCLPQGQKPRPLSKGGDRGEGM